MAAGIQWMFCQGLNIATQLAFLVVFINFGHFFFITALFLWVIKLYFHASSHMLTLLKFLGTGVCILIAFRSYLTSFPPSLPRSGWLLQKKRIAS